MSALAAFNTSVLSTATSFATLANEGLEPGARVFIDDDTAVTATVCSTEQTSPWACVRLDGSGERCRVASWRLACLD